MDKHLIIGSAIIVAIIVLIYWVSKDKSSSEAYDPGYYANGNGKKRMIPVLLDDAGTDADFWFRDRHNDRIRGFYKGSKLTRTGCDFVNNYQKMLPWGSKIYTDGGPTYDI